MTITASGRTNNFGTRWENRERGNKSGFLAKIFTLMSDDLVTPSCFISLCFSLNCFVLYTTVLSFCVLNRVIVMLQETCQKKVNIQDFLQIFQGSGIGKMEDN